MRTVADLIIQSFAKFSQETAVKHGENLLSYQTLLKRAEVVSGCLLQKSAAHSKIGLVGQRNLAVYEGLVGAVLSGSIYVPLNPKFPLHKKVSIIQQSEIQILISSQSDRAEVESLQNETQIEMVIFPDADEVWFRGERLSFSQFAPEKAKVQEQDLIYIMFTSGSTGQPKGVMVTHGNVMALMSNLQNFYPDLQPGYRNSQTFDLSFDPSVCDMFFTWLNGGTLCVMNPAEIFMPADYIRREGIELWHSVPMIGEYLGKLGHLKPDHFPSLRYTVFTGEPCKKKVADAWRVAAPKSTIENRYGPTELTVDCLRFDYRLEDQQQEFINGLLPIGRPYKTLESQIVTEDLKLCSPGEKGELVVAGPQVTAGYLKDIEKTEKVFVRMNWDSQSRIWYRTGDSAVQDLQGNVHCLGRIDNQVKLAGKRVEIGEIEHSLLSTGLLKEVVVVPYGLSGGIVQSLVAFCDRDLNSEDVMEIKTALQQQLDLSFFPKKFYQLKEIPLSANGKVDRKHLQSLAEELMRS